MNDKVDINSAHSLGFTCLEFSRNGRFAYTGGADTLVRVWKINEGTEQEPPVAIEAEEAINAIASGNDCWLSGSEDSQVRRYLTGMTDLDALVTKSNAVPIRCISVDPKGKRVAVGSDELEVKLIDLEDTIKIEKLSGHTKAVRRVTWHPSGSLLTTCGADGKVIVWDVSGDSAKQIAVIEGVIPAVSKSDAPEFMHDCSAVWHTSGQYFYTVSRGHEIVVVSRDTWSKTATFSDDTVSGTPTALALSPSGGYLASASGKDILVWSTQTRKLLFKHSFNSDASILQLAWSPTTNLLAWTDSDGVFSRWIDPIPSSSPDPVRTPGGSGTLASVPVKRSVELDLFGAGPGDDTAEGDGGIDFDLEGNDWIVDDVGGGMEDEPVSKVDGHVREMVSITKAQPAFQPASTPMESKKRFLAYNMIGVIEVTDQDTHHIVNVEFHDRSARRSYHFTDNFKYSFGSLGDKGALFACEPENDYPARVIYKPYTSWATASQIEWTYTLPPSQHILGLAASLSPSATSSRVNGDMGETGAHGHVALATSVGDLTFLTGSGLERMSIGLEGDFVSMIAGPDWVFVVYRAGATTIDGSQNLMGAIIMFDDYTVLQRGMLPIPKGHTLKWIGVAEEGAPAIYDTTGYVHVLARYRAPMRASWIRVLDTHSLERRQGKDESYWPVGVNVNTFHCLILKGRQQHPSFPRPLIQELPMTLPFRNPDPKMFALEEHYHRATLFNDIERDALPPQTLTTPSLSSRALALDKELIQLIQAACKAERLQRALDLTALLSGRPSVDMAIKVAKFYALAGLVERMEAVADEMDDGKGRDHVAERRRAEWTESMESIPGSERAGGPSVSSRSRPTAFDNFGPPPKVERPGWGTVKPVVETTKFSGKTRAAPTTSYEEDSVPSPPEGKRKRIEEEDTVGWDTEDPDTKRQALTKPEKIAPPMVPKGNPFARKSGQEPVARNPFSRKLETNKSIRKSDSFFEKVDTEPTNQTKRPAPAKSKDKKEAGRQTTLFGLEPPSAPEKKTRKKTDPEPLPVTNTPEAEAQVTETQISDVAMTDDGVMPEENLLVETQVNAETQIMDETQTTDSLIDWVPSPAPEDNIDEPVPV